MACVRSVSAQARRETAILRSMSAVVKDNTAVAEMSAMTPQARITPQSDQEDPHEGKNPIARAVNICESESEHRGESIGGDTFHESEAESVLKETAVAAKQRQCEAPQLYVESQTAVAAQAVNGTSSQKWATSACSLATGGSEVYIW